MLALVYYHCPMLCTLVLNGLASTLQALPFDAGPRVRRRHRQLRPDARRRSARPRRRPPTSTRYGRPGAAAGWHFLTGDAAAIDALTERGRLPLRRRRDERRVRARGGRDRADARRPRLARYLFGVEFAPATCARAGRGRRRHGSARRSSSSCCSASTTTRRRPLHRGRRCCWLRIAAALTLAALVVSDRRPAAARAAGARAPGRRRCRVEHARSRSPFVPEQASTLARRRRSL